MQTLRSLDELDAKIAECNRAEAISDDAMRAIFSTFQMDPPAHLPLDPFSDAYRQAQLQLYSDLAGRFYSVTNEVTSIDVNAAIGRPFPFCTESGTTAGEYFMAVGFVLRAMKLPRGSRIVEFGPGWGHTSLMLAKLGYRVTVVEIAPHFCELIKQRAALEGVTVEVVNDDFLWIERSDQTFDAALFFECFHHAADHLRLLRSLRNVLVPEGCLFFGGEPITNDFPMPWGIRLDGNSLWAIRKNGWLELGFREDYFRQALAETGWYGQRHTCADPPWLTFWEARKRDQPVFRTDGSDLRISTIIGQRRGTAIEFEDGRAGTAFYGPYVNLPAGKYLARITLRRSRSSTGRAQMDAASNSGRIVLAACAIDACAIDSRGTSFTLPFRSDDDIKALEVRLFCESGFCATFDALEIFIQ